MTAPPAPRAVLHQFPYSHFNEKARWGLDWKRVPHHRTSYLPGPHAPWIRRLSGQTATPVLVLDGDVIAGSARILETLERRFPERPLLPEDPALRDEALAIQRRFDAEVGPAVRTAVFSVLIEEPDYLCAIFAGGKTRPVRRLYRATFPLVRSIMARANGTHDPAGVQRAFATTRGTLDWIAKRVDRGGPLVGDRFGIADLTSAALLAVLVDPPHPDMARPKPMPERFAAFLAQWAEHPAAGWVLEQYRLHRPESAATPASGSA